MKKKTIVCVAGVLITHIISILRLEEVISFTALMILIVLVTILLILALTFLEKKDK